MQTGHRGRGKILTMGWEIKTGDCLEVMRGMAADSVNCCVTSPPYYGLRDYRAAGQIGLEAEPQEYIGKLVQVFDEVRRVLRPDGTLWLNLGDCYAGGGRGEKRQIPHGDGRETDPYRDGRTPAPEESDAPRAKLPANLKPKDLVGIPWMAAFALRQSGWYLRSDIIWEKPNCMPGSMTDRPTSSHEYIFLLSKSERYFYDQDAIREPHGKIRKSGPNAMRGQTEIRPRGNGQSIDEQSYHPLGRNKRSIWRVATRPSLEDHAATFPLELIDTCIIAGCPAGGLVLDPFNGTGTTGVCALRLGRDYYGIEINPTFADGSRRRIENDAPLFNRK